MIRNRYINNPEILITAKGVSNKNAEIKCQPFISQRPGVR
jgi:hypothetical protein